MTLQLLSSPRDIYVCLKDQSTRVVVQDAKAEHHGIYDDKGNTVGNFIVIPNGKGNTVAQIPSGRTQGWYSEKRRPRRYVSPHNGGVA